jgi:cardiolipin synthase
VTRWIVSHHVVSLVVGLLTLAFVRAVLRQPRPSGSALAWLLIIVFAPYIGMPLYLMLGGRNLQRARRAKAPIASPPVTEDDGEVGPFGLRQLGVRTSALRVEWLTDGVEAFETLLQAIATAKETIRIVTYLIGSDPKGTAILDALSERASKGARARLHSRFEASDQALGEVLAEQSARLLRHAGLPLDGIVRVRGRRRVPSGTDFSGITWSTITRAP